VALLAGVGTGVWKDAAQACRETIQVMDRTPPDPESMAVYNRYYPVYRGLYGSLRDHFAELAEA
jgi:xylulokinase